MESDELYFKPDIVEVDVGEEFQVEVWLDTKGIEIDGVDVDLPLGNVELVKKEIHNALGMVFPGTRENTLLFSQITIPGEAKFKGLAKLATLTLKAKEESQLNFNFTLGSTTDSNMSVGGVDMLTDVGNLIINIGENMDVSLLIDLQALANKYNVKLSGTATPVSTPEDFEVAPS